MKFLVLVLLIACAIFFVFAIQKQADASACAKVTYSTDCNYGFKPSMKKFKGYWLGTKDEGVRFTIKGRKDVVYPFLSEAYFAAHDENYVPGDKISADMKVLHDKNDPNYVTVKARWDKYYSEDNVRLYASYLGGATERTGSDRLKPTSPLHEFVEFRILEVSGADGHKLHDGKTSDGSAVTFMATHFLPTAYKMNATSSNVGGWGSSQLYRDLNYVDGLGGELYNRFSSEFVSQVKSITKEYCAGGGVPQTATPKTVDCKFWIPSCTELIDDVTTNSHYSGLPALEGTQYAWCDANLVDAKDMGEQNSSDQNDGLILRTRAGDEVLQRHSAGWYRCSVWWLRSPAVDNSSGYAIGGGRSVEWPYQADLCCGVVPAFSF